MKEYLIPIGFFLGFISDLQKAYNSARFQYGWSDRRISDIMSGIDFHERCYHLLNERGIIKAEISAFMEIISQFDWKNENDSNQQNIIDKAKSLIQSLKQEK